MLPPTPTFGAPSVHRMISEAGTLDVIPIQTVKAGPKAVQPVVLKLSTFEVRSLAKVDGKS